jgi:hypothetical protein
VAPLSTSSTTRLIATHPPSWTNAITNTQA